MRIDFGQITFIDQGEEIVCGQGQPQTTIVVVDQRFYSSLAFGGAIGGAESYIEGCWTCEQLTDLVRILLRNRSVLKALDQTAVKKAFFKILHYLNRDTEIGSKKNIAAHYDLGNKFFELFLDPSLTYSSGIFNYDTQSMEEASVAKLDLICKKLNLNKEDNIIEIGTGWGSFAIHAASHYGCHVTTTTISQQQYNVAKSRVKKAGLEDKITLLKEDYRNLSGTFSKLVSIEMIEAVGLNFLEGYLKKCASLLKPEGSMLIQSITIADQHYEKAKRSVDFIQRYIFPGGALPSVTALTYIATNCTDLRIYALDDITEHYAMTLRRWRERYYKNIEEIKKLGYNNKFLRMWEYYLCYCEGGFDERAIGCIQIEFHKPLYSTSIQDQRNTDI
ncbi:MAG: class I SAM-dependent methyltransferase [Pseudomonadales bacterium]|nr:class I SAM-dependent methyltransferase [Pseudomonadales bacterium]